MLVARYVVVVVTFSWKMRWDANTRLTILLKKKEEEEEEGAHTANETMPPTVTEQRSE